MLKPYFTITGLLSIATFVILASPNFPRTQPQPTIESIRSRIIINKTTCDSLKIYFGVPIQKKFLHHVDYYFNKLDNGLPATLSINFNDTIVNGNTTVKSFILGQPGKGKVASAGI